MPHLIAGSSLIHKRNFFRRIFFQQTHQPAILNSIDKWAIENDIRDIDLMKLNAQSTELKILKGTTSILDKVIGWMVGESFVELYKKRPFFSDIDSYLREKQFRFFDVDGYRSIGRARSPITTHYPPGLFLLWGLLIEGHAIYFRDSSDMEIRGISTLEFSLQKVLKLICFAGIFGQPKFVFELLEWLHNRQFKLSEYSSGKDLVGSIKKEAEEHPSNYGRMFF